MLDRLTIERMRAIAEGRTIAVAVSGGGDSLALLQLLAEEFGPKRLRTLVVDHALREGSRPDALAACENARALGVDAELLTVKWSDDSRKSQQSARRARYQILLSAAKRAGANLIALGHTADDQAETVLMRARADSGWRGLAGMAAIAPAPVWPDGLGVGLARPLLNARRAALRGALNQRGSAWIEDPANTNVAFERVRARARLAELEAAGFDPLRLVQLAARLRTHVDALDAAAEALIGQAVRFEGPRIVIDCGSWRGDPETRRAALSVLTVAAAGAERGPESLRLAVMESHINQVGFRGATLGGVRFRRKRGEVWLERDRGAVFGRGRATAAAAALSPGRPVVWDGRAAVTAFAEGLSVQPLADGGLTVGAGAASIEWLLEAHVRHLLAWR